jgi:hypothetical protein
MACSGPPPEGVIKRAEIEIVLLKERPNFKPEQFIDDRFYKAALKARANEKIDKEEKSHGSQKP